jgi:hypothetical protein
MKRIAILTLIVFFCVEAFSQKTIKIEETASSFNQDNTEIQEPVQEQKTIRFAEPKQHQEIQTLFKKDKRNGFYGSISLGYSPIDNKDALVVSSRGCIIMDRWFAFGFGGTAFINNINDFNFYDQIEDIDNLTGAYGGLIIEPIALPMKPVHLSFPILIGGGVVTPFNNYNYHQYTYIEDYFFVVEPGIELEVNFTKWMRIAAFATYRYTSEIKLDDISKSALRSYSTGLTVKIGLF